MQPEQQNNYSIVLKSEVRDETVEDQVIHSLLADAIGREPLDEDYPRVELSYSSTNPKLRFISVDEKCLGALIYEQEPFIGDDKVEEKETIRFNPDIKR